MTGGAGGKSADVRIRRLRARAQLVGEGARAGEPVDVLEQVFAVQAQDAGAAALGLRARGVREWGQVAAALEGERSVFRGWFMRGTLHLVPATDARWLLGLYGPRNIAANARRYRELGLDDALCERAEQLLLKAVVEHGPLTRAELTERLTRGLGIPAKGQAAIHLISRACLAGLICHGPEKGGEQAFVALGDWLPEAGAVPGDPVAELARRYGRAYGPADAEDFAVWSGLPKSMARAAWEPVAPDPLPGRREADVRLLPMYDGHWLGHRDRNGADGRIRPGGGQIRAAVVADGAAVGTWSRPGGTVRIDLFGEAGSVAVEAEQAAVTRFLHP
ncbi:winged helix DNA-binding domain-containing protein [Streptomyces sp. A7024]|uniref:Winged helix DNA-binding domain-containing protein n=1 Tax=Streptomyces coryli TaxID=1128680 RepID=A0A6G4U805_9ACTN|nr:winged helix DNA-binding domain-containing protein [Streptomyces coryli]